MSVTRCYLCEQDPLFQRRMGQSGLAEGQNCPICFRPTCRYHLTTVRWYWRDTGKVGTALICKECKRTYQHRTWDSLHRDWIT
ncbi:MAG: hypothetical protein P8183_03125 [Anaerolineae bacterium]|jgi:hypothetical protein